MTTPRTTPFDADDLIDALDTIGIDDLDTDDIRTDYSGRGMYGARCFGIVVSQSQAGLIGLGIAAAIMGTMDDTTAEDALAMAAEIVRCANTGSMGRGTIVYFPGWLLAGTGADNDGDGLHEVDEGVTGLARPIPATPTMHGGGRMPVVRHLPHLSVADRCALGDALRRFELDPARKVEEAAYVAKFEAELAAERARNPV